MLVKISVDMNNIYMVFLISSIVLFSSVVADNLVYKKAYEFHRKVLSLGEIRKLDITKQNKIFKECVFLNRAFIVIDTIKKISLIFSLTTTIIIVLFFISVML